ncbi:MAG: hypothetical protein C0596_15005 [Marinilabiliales bacterium]|nr:MAG: hypothetical protein C0596_15005 [Marinilabiliales bacterium]
MKNKFFFFLLILCIGFQYQLFAKDNKDILYESLNNVKKGKCIVSETYNTSYALSLRFVSRSRLVYGINIAGFSDGMTCGIALRGFTRDYTNGISVSGIHSIGTINGINFSLLTYADRLNGIGIGAINYWTTANGLVLGAFNLYGHKFNGVSVGLTNSIGYRSCVCGYCHAMSGLQIGLFNRARRNWGVQFGLINQSYNGKGVQFGLINIRSANPWYCRILPIVNFKMNKEEESKDKHLYESVRRL